jgi:hypothetical protein
MSEPTAFVVKPTDFMSEPNGFVVEPTGLVSELARCDTKKALLTTNLLGIYPEEVLSTLHRLFQVNMSFIWLRQVMNVKVLVNFRITEWIKNVVENSAPVEQTAGIHEHL